MFGRSSKGGSGKTTLYRHYSGRSPRAPRRSLLYVGITSNPKRRSSQHKVSKPWYGDVKHTKMKQYKTREAAAAAERKAIRSKRPKHNIVGVPKF